MPDSRAVEPPTLETDRLIIRPFRGDDLAEFAKLLDIPEVAGWRQQRSRAAAFLDWHISNYARMDIRNGIVCLGMFRRQDAAVLGAVGVGEHDDLHEPELFYSLLPVARGRGYATEAAAAVTSWALVSYDLPYLIATATVDNVASQRVLARCGYELIDERSLLVHITGERHAFRYYRRYRLSADRPAGC